MSKFIVALVALFLAAVTGVYGTTCVCTTVPCPVSGDNYLNEGMYWELSSICCLANSQSFNVCSGGGATGDYYYVMHNGYAVVYSAKVTITKANLDMGTETTSCTQTYSRNLDDDGVQDCDAGHILAHRLGGPGNQPINIFPQVYLVVIVILFGLMCLCRIPTWIVVHLPNMKDKFMTVLPHMVQLLLRWVGHLPITVPLVLSLTTSRTQPPSLAAPVPTWNKRSSTIINGVKNIQCTCACILSYFDWYFVAIDDLYICPGPKVVIYVSKVCIFRGIRY